MFTGIIQSVQKGEFIDGVLKVKRCWEDLEIGESIAINGVCLTLRKFDDEWMYFDVGLETLSKTNLSTCSIFNLERALKIGDSLSGHYVTGHVDGMIRFISKVSKGNTVYMKFSMPPERWAVVRKGSIALNGISLTIASADLDSFTVQIIPHTLENTNLKFLRLGDTVNYEIDMLARYVEGILSHKKKELIERWEF